MQHHLRRGDRRRIGTACQLVKWVRKIRREPPVGPLFMRATRTVSRRPGPRLLYSRCLGAATVRNTPLINGGGIPIFREQSREDSRTSCDKSSA